MHTYISEETEIAEFYERMYSTQKEIPAYEEYFKEINTVDVSGSGSKVFNNKGVPYPEIEVNGYGKIELPSGPYEPNNSKLLRPKFTDSYKK